METGEIDSLAPPALDRVRFEDSLRPLIEPAYRIAYAQLRDRGQAEDAVQEACFKAWRKFRQLRAGAGAIRPWFFKIVTNECRMARRNRWWKVVTLPDLAFAQLRSAADDAAANIDLRAEIAKLGPEQRLLLFLYFGLDLPFEEIGPVVGLSPKAAKARLYRITRRLKPGLQVSEVFP
jgi:RNA polymerase sigma-70 factor (ECF subfamily)